MSTLWIANLDAERQWAGLPPPSPAAAARAVELGGLVAALAAPGDTIWTEGPIPAERRPHGLDAERLGWCHGPAPRGDWARAVPWAVTTLAVGLAGPLARDWPSVEAARRANDKTWAHRLSVELGDALPGAAEIDGLEACDRAIVGLPTERWVLKAAFGAAGRERLLGRGPLVAPLRARAARLLERGPAVLEPWVARSLDLAVLAELGPGGLVLHGRHAQRIDGSGVFRGAGALSPRDADALDPLDDRVRALAHALAGLGYHGPFGVDAFLWRDESGVTRLRALSDVNARLGFGFLARALRRRFPGHRLVLDGLAARATAASPVELLAPSPRAPFGAWLEPEAAPP